MFGCVCVVLRCVLSEKGFSTVVCLLGHCFISFHSIASLGFLLSHLRLNSLLLFIFIFFNMHSVYGYIFNIVYSGSFVDNIVELHNSFAMPSILYIRLQIYRERLLIMPYYHSSRDYQFTRLDYVSAALVCYEKKGRKKNRERRDGEKIPPKHHEHSVHFTLLLLLLYKRTKSYYFVIQFLFLLLLLSTSMSWAGKRGSFI